MKTISTSLPTMARRKATVERAGTSWPGLPGRFDSSGWSMTGRGDDGFAIGGQVVLASDVEQALGAVPGVAELVCVAEPHARLGQRVVAVVRPHPGSDPVPALRVAARRLPPAARPVRYVLMAELPRTAGGKVARAALRDRVAATGRIG